MFSFFRKKPVPDEHSADPGTSDPTSDRLPEGGGGNRPRTAIEWLNADVGELFFGKKPVPQAPAGAVPAQAPRDAAQAAAHEPAHEPAHETAHETAAQETVPLEPIATHQAPAVEDRSAWLARLRAGLARTGTSIADALVGATLSEAMLEDLEAALLQADAGSAATRHLLDELQRRITRADIRDPDGVRRVLADCIVELLEPLEKALVVGEQVPTVIMVAGVNGAGKTTSVGKLARHLVDSRQKVLLAAADTFRAAAREQLLAWAERADPSSAAAAPGERGAAGGRVEIVSQDGGDPAGVTFDAVVAGKARGCDVVIVDTAGRLATQSHLMEELKKIRRTIAKAQPGAPHEVLLVIDGNTGQNALAQAQAFDEALQLTGLVITKLDGTAKGGVLAAIALWSRSRAEPLPVYFIGVGEKLADLQTFRAREFAAALLS